MSSFHGLEMAKQALSTQQSALYTTGHNIANANTEGYTRQRVNFEAESAFPAAARNRPGIAGQIGTGVKAGSVQRIRNEFLDVQFRGENSLAGYWETRAESLGRMESVMNELNDTGLSASMDQFWGALQDLAVNPTNSGARSVVVQRGIALADTFNYFNGSLSQIRSDLKNELDVTVKNANTITSQIDSLNSQITKLETNGYLPNDLYDQRDVLIDSLSKMMDIEVEYGELSSGAMAIAEGPVKIKVADKILVDGEGPREISINPEPIDSELGYVKSIEINGEEIDMSNVSQIGGTIESLIKVYGYRENETDTSSKGDFVELQDRLNNMASKFVEEFNKVNAKGITNGGMGSESHDFFSYADGKMDVTSQIIENPDRIAKIEDAGDGTKALDLAGVFDSKLTFGTVGQETEASIKDYYASVIGSLGVQVQEAERMNSNTTILLTQIEGQRQSVSSVSLDEEMTNMIKFQHAYNAAARSLTATDEMLDRIINNMGLVGR